MPGECRICGCTEMNPCALRYEDEDHPEESCQWFDLGHNALHQSAVRGACSDRRAARDDGGCMLFASLKELPAEYRCRLCRAVKPIERMIVVRRKRENTIL